MLSFYGNGAAADGGGSTVEQLWERGSGEDSIQQILTGTTKSNNASGKEAVAEGNATTASGNYSHAEGRNTIASTTSAHAEGLGSLASGQYSHAEGFNTTASENSAHAEGYVSRASGKYSHAEGSQTIASSTASHAEGYNTTAAHRYSHVEGMNTIATTYGTHAEGNATTVSGTYAHAEGYATKAEGGQSHSEGQATRAIGVSAHAEGQTTTASGDYSHSEGYYTKASALHTHAQNYYTIAASTAQTALGKYNIEDNQNQYAVILGNGTASNARSNAAMVDWNGNLSIAGGLTLDMNSVNPTIITPSKMDTIDEVLAHIVDIDSVNGQYEFVNRLGEPISWQELKDYAYILQETHTEENGEQEYIVDYQSEAENDRYYLYITSLAGFDTVTFKMKYNRIVYGFNGADSNIASQRIYDIVTVNYAVANS